MVQPTRNTYGLNEADYKRLASWMAEVAVQLSPGVKVKPSEEGTRIGNAGSLCIYRDGHWYSYEAGEGDRNPFSLIQFIQSDLEDDVPALHRFAVEWLRTHPGEGSIDSSGSGA